MRVLKLFLIFSAMFLVTPAYAADAKDDAGVDVGAPPDAKPSGRLERPQRKAVKLSPSVHASPMPDESSKKRRVTPTPAASPLQDVPALKDISPSPGG